MSDLLFIGLGILNRQQTLFICFMGLKKCTLEIKKLFPFEHFAHRECCSWKFQRFRRHEPMSIGKSSGKEFDSCKLFWNYLQISKSFISPSSLASWIRKTSITSGKMRKSSKFSMNPDCCSFHISYTLTNNFSVLLLKWFKGSVLSYQN